MNESPSLAGRAAVAIVLMIGFYVLAVGLAILLLWIPYAELVYAKRVHPKLLIFCIIGAGMILWSILPRWDKFAAPGPELKPHEHPKLFQELRGIAQATKQAMPSEVFLVTDMNAWVAQRGGVMGFGSRRVMGLGLPLLQALNISEFRAVLAHEFGHFYGGDTMLGPWIYKTRNAIRRTVWNLAQSRSILTYPFFWYGNMFLRITQAVSRQQELAADQLAASTVGARHLADGLVAVHGGAMAVEAYWNQEVNPALGAGYRPPLAEGFAYFLGSSRVKQAVEEGTEQELKHGQGDRYDSHPPLRERVAVLKQSGANSEPTRSEPAISSLADTARAEQSLLQFVLDPKVFQGLKSARWEQMGADLYIPSWKTLVAENTGAVRGIRPSELPERASRYAPLFQEGLGGLDESQAKQRYLEMQVMGAALALAASLAGAELRCMPGELYFERNGTKMEPFSILPQMAKGEMPAQEWGRICGALGLADQDLATLAGF